MTSESLAQPPVSTTQRIAWAILIVATLAVCYFANLSVIGFVGPDEPRYAWIARDMAESGDWVTPRLYGRPWFEKPPLLYWGGAIFFKLIPTHPEIAARLPSAISALLATLALAWLAWRTYGEECARWLLLLLPTSVGMIGFSHAAATDMPFAAMLTLAMVCAAVALDLVPASEDTPVLPRTPWLALLLFGFFLGLAVLAKGPAAIILSGGAVFFWAIFTKRWRDAFRLLHPAAFVTFCATALPWYILCARQNPDFFRIFIIEHNFKRFLTPEFQHTQPFWFYVPVLLVAFVPWVASIIWSLAVGSRIRHLHPTTLLLLCFAVFCIAFFSVSKSKLPGYVLPALPVIGLLLARSWQAFRQTNLKSLRISAAIGAGLFGVTSILLFALGRVPAHASHLNEKAGSAYGWLTLLFALANIFLIFVRSDKTSPPLPPLAAFPILIAVLFAPIFVDASFQHDPSGRTLGNTMRSRIVLPDNLFVGNMNRGKHYGLNFYIGKEVRDWDPAHPSAGLLLLRHKNCKDLVVAPYVCSAEPNFLEDSGDFLYEITLPISLPRDGSGRQPQ